MLATRLAEHVGLPVPATEIIEVDDWLIQNTRELRVEGVGSSILCKPGLQFGARCVCDPDEGQIFDYLPESMFDRVKNREAFAGMLALDKWLGNANGRQVVFWKKNGDRKYRVTFIDQGYCFNAGEWTFPDLALHGVYYRNFVYQHVRGWESFDPWLSRIENFSPATIREIAGEIPPEWCGNDWDALKSMVEVIIERRRGRLRELIAAFRDSSRNPFPEWGKVASETVAQAYVM